MSVANVQLRGGKMATVLRLRGCGNPSPVGPFDLLGTWGTETPPVAVRLTPRPGEVVDMWTHRGFWREDETPHPLDIVSPSINFL